MEHSRFVGIDISKDHLDVHVRPTGDSFRVRDDDAGLVTLVAHLRPLAPVVLVLEATGGYEVTVAATLASVLFASPSRTVCSCTTSGRRHIQAASPTGTATYPPVASTTSGLCSAMIERACATPNGTRPMSRMFAGDTMRNGLAARRIFPVVHVITPDGGRRMPDEEVAVIADRMLASRMQRPDGPAAPLT